MALHGQWVNMRRSIKVPNTDHGDTFGSIVPLDDPNGMRGELGTAVIAPSGYVRQHDPPGR